jgi:hypothetical protein
VGVVRDLDRIGIDELAADSAAYDGLVARAHYLDAFCSSSDWVLPAHTALMPPREPWLFRGEGGFVAMATGTHARGFRYAEPLEAAWGLACPVVGVGARAFAKLCAVESESDVLLIGGVLDGSPFAAEIARELGRRFALQRGTTTTRHVASLAGGVDGFLSRRSRSLRRGVRRAVGRVADAGIRFETAPSAAVAAVPALYARVLDVEARTWKGIAGVGIAEGGMRPFYASMAERLAARGALRLTFARRDDRDVGYILGGVFGDGYRGLQFGYDAELRHLGLGHACQFHQIEALCREGVQTYDLGTTGGDYKRRWAETEIASSFVLAVRA